MLSRRLRLSRDHFEAAGSGQKAQSPHFSVIFKTTKNGGCAAVVSKKVARRAVDRHLLKRRILALMRPWCSPNRSLIVYARAGAPTLPYRALTAELSPLLSHAAKVA